MTGASLWLVPPASHPLSSILSALIHSALPALLEQQSAPRFAPHLTLTSDIDLPPLLRSHGSGSDAAQRWLDSVAWPGADNDAVVEVRFRELGTGPTFTKKLFVRCARTAGLLRLAARARVEAGVQGGGLEAAEEWAQSEYDPHVSLMYGEFEVGEEELETVGGLLRERGVLCAEDAAPGVAGWTGGSIWLVDTSKPIGEWKPMASVELGDGSEG